MIKKIYFSYCINNVFRSRSKTPSRENQESPKLSLKSANVVSGSSSFQDNLEYSGDKVKISSSLKDNLEYSGDKVQVSCSANESVEESYEKDRFWDEKSAMESVRSLSQEKVF